jgi:hypothetical protein
MRTLLLRVCDACAGALPAEWGEAARAEARTIGGTWALLRWTLGLVRLRLAPRGVRRQLRARRAR